MLMKAVEARKKAEVVHMHTDTHRPLHKKSPSHYSLDGFRLSLFLCTPSLLSPFIFFLHTYQVKRFWPSSTFPLNAQQH